MFLKKIKNNNYIIYDVTLSTTLFLGRSPSEPEKVYVILGIITQVHICVFHSN